MNEVKGKILWLDRDMKPYMQAHLRRLQLEGYGVFEFSNWDMIAALEYLIEMDDNDLDLIIVEPSFPLKPEEEEFFEELRSRHSGILSVPEHERAKGAILIHVAAALRPNVPVFVFSMCSKGDIGDIPKMLKGLEKLSNVVGVSYKMDLADTALFVEKISQIIESPRQKKRG